MAINLVREQIVKIFGRLGFAVAEGPTEIEDDWHNFTALNLPETHPARDMQDTFYIQQNPDWLLRTHIPAAYRSGPWNGRNRRSASSARGGYTSMRPSAPGAHFVSFTRRKGCMSTRMCHSPRSRADALFLFVQEMFDKDIKVRFRPSYFPFTEPSAEMDITCRICWRQRL